MRCYHLANFYLPGIHAGIQSAHVQHELAIKYLQDDDADESQAEMYKEWAFNYKTIIVLNGGWQASLQEWVQFLSSNEHPFAWAHFHEEQDALNGALTNVGVVLPQHIYGVSRELRDGGKPGVSNEIQLPSGDVLALHGCSASLLCGTSGHILHVYTPFELELIQRIGRLGLM